MKELLVYVVAPPKAMLFISYAAYLAKDLGMAVRYIQVLEPSSFPLSMPGGISAKRKVSQKDIDMEIEKAEHHFKIQIDNLCASEPDLPDLEYHVETGNSPDVIIRLSRDERVEAVMLGGSNGSSLVSDDSSNVKIIRKVDCPVWIIPEGITYKPFSEIIYATDYHEEDIPNLRLLANFASRFPATITAVHISRDAGPDEKSRAEKYAGRIKKETGYEMVSVKVLAETKGEPIVDELHNFALMIDADLIVFLRENRHTMDRLLHGSRSEKMARVSRLPVLIFNET
jgi:nucleotide-binding universal stress UspA family protein